MAWIAKAGLHMLGFARSRGLRFWASSVIMSAGAITLYYGVRFVTTHSSRCPKVVASSIAGSHDDSTHRQGVQGFTILVDAIRMNRAGSDLEVYYDVCGLEAGTSFTTRIAVAKHESGLRRIFGGSTAPMTVAYQETASGPATRRHRTLSFKAMPPGSYALDVMVIDGDGRRREKDLEFQVPGR